MRPRVNLMWASMGTGDSNSVQSGIPQVVGAFGHPFSTPDGRMDTVGLEGFRDGTVDYRVLRHLERIVEENPEHEKVRTTAMWLQRIYDKIETQFWPDGVRPEYSGEWDVADTAVPPVDCAAVRRQALTYIVELSIPWADPLWPAQGTPPH